MIYPRLFEDFEDPAIEASEELTPLEIRQAIAGSVSPKQKIKIDPLNNIFSVDGNNPDDEITWDYLFNLVNSNYSKKLKAFVGDKLDIDVQDEIDRAKKIRKRKREGNPDFLPEIEIDLTHGDFWQYQLDTFEPSESKSGSKKSKKETEGIFSQIDFNVYKNLKSFFEKNDKETDYESFQYSIEQSGDSGNIGQQIEKVLSIMDEIVGGEKDSIKINDWDLSYTLHKKDFKSWEDDMLHYIQKYVDPDDLNEIYKDKILKTGTFLNLLFAVFAQQVGRGEVLLVYTIPGASFAGVGLDYDIVIDGSQTYEVKDYSGLKGSGSPTEPIRLGTGGKLTRFQFYQNLKDTIKVAKRVWGVIGEEDLKKIIGRNFFKLWKHLISHGNTRWDLASGVEAGEIGGEKMRLIRMWYYFAHEFIESELEDNGQYNMAILKGINMQPTTVMIEPLSNEDIKDGTEVKISSMEGVEGIANELKILPYVQDPNKLDNDLDHIPNVYFENVGNMDYFIVFRKDHINIAGPNDFTYATISQSSVKIIEKNIAKKKKKAKEAYSKWKKDLETKANQKGIKKEDKEAYLKLKRSTPYMEFLRGEISESYYPRLNQYN